VQRVEHEERRAGERRFAHAVRERGHGIGPAVGGGEDATALDRHAGSHLGGVALGLAGRDPGGRDRVEDLERLRRPSLDAEGTGELGRHDGADVGGVRVVVCGLTEPLLARRGITEIPQAVDHLLFVPPVSGRFGGHLVDRVIHPSIIAALGAHRAGMTAPLHVAMLPRGRYAAGSMTRIIAGAAGSLTLAVPRSGTRPTSDRVREAIFSALEARDAIDGSAVLDLYAGSGALGLEAASRGAAEVVLVERAKAAADVCRRNADAVGRALRGRPARVRVAMRPVAAYLESATGGFDLVFIDPPYELDEKALTHDLALLAPLLAPHAVVVVERSSRSPEPGWPDGIVPERRRDYGETTLWWAEAQPERPSQPE
jgi:16S rRNA (guanine966-N2)-methyltransferase